MKFSCEKFILQNAVNSAIKAVSTKTTMNVLECLHITATEEIITISGFDLNMAIKTTFEANIFNQGSCLINAKLLLDILRKLPDDEITITVNDDLKAKIVCGKAIFDIMTIDSSEFPEIPMIEKQKFFQINSPLLKEIINQTKFAKSDNESKLIHTGFLFELTKDELTVVTVDGYRLALRREKIAMHTLEETSFVIPGTALIELEKLLGEEDVYIFLDEKHILFEINNIILTTRLIDGEFLKYKESIPKDLNNTISCEIQGLKSTIDRVSLIISEQIKNPIRFTFEDNIIKLSCITTIGKSYDEFHFEGEVESFEIGFNNKYIIEALNACPDKEANLSFNGPLSPVIITPIDDSDHFLYLILPVRLNSNE
ncbi:MAG: DNA polymerase III subunit beta [Clostridia bacterium]